MKYIAIAQYPDKHWISCHIPMSMTEIIEMNVGRIVNLRRTTNSNLEGNPPWEMLSRDKIRETIREIPRDQRFNGDDNHVGEFTFDADPDSVQIVLIEIYG